MNRLRGWSRRTRYLRQKLLQLAIVVFAVTLLTFSLLQALPGDAAINIAGPGATEEQLAEVRARYGLDQPVPVQYVRWLKNMVTGDLGISTAYNTPVSELIKQRFPISLLLMFYAMFISLGLAIPLGVFAAYRPNSGFDKAASGISFGLLSVPSYIVAVVGVYLFAIKLSWVPAISNYVGFFDDPVEHFRQMVLPSISLAIGQIAVFMRLLRSDMIATLQQDFITMARAKGMPTGRILFRHAFRPSTFSLITAAAVSIGGLIGGTVVVESIFALPGMGLLTVESITRRDFLVVQTCVTIFAVVFVLANFIVDLMYAAIDPRIRHARALA